MSYESYRLVFYSAAVLSVIMLIISILLFIFLHISNVIGYFTGSNERKAIKSIRENNEKNTSSIYKSAALKNSRSSVTDKITASGRIISNSANIMNDNISTEKISREDFANETTILNIDKSEETTLLENTDGNETTVLNQMPESRTTIPEPSAGSTVFEIEYEITFIHTDEVIV